MKNLRIASAMALALLCLTGCNGINTWVAGVESAGAADAAGVAANLHTANVLAVQAWKREACGLTLGGLSGAGDSVAAKAAIQSCPPPNVLIVSGADGMTVALPPAAIPAPIAPAGAPQP